MAAAPGWCSCQPAIVLNARRQFGRTYLSGQLYTMGYINYNGKLYREDTAIVGADDRGLRYGDGLFETMKVEEGRIIFKDAHFERLWQGMGVLEMLVPSYLTREMLAGEIELLCRKNNCTAAARVRLSIIRGKGGLYDSLDEAPYYIIQAWPLPTGVGTWNDTGLVAGIYPEVRKSCDLLSNLKHNNYLLYVMGALHAKKQGWNDAIILNTQERVCDSTIANVFIIKNGVVYTPALAEGCVAGVMRKMLLQALPGFGFEWKEQAITTEELQSADEIFFTNSMFNIRSVQRLGEREYGQTITREIYALFLPTIC